MKNKFPYHHTSKTFFARCKYINNNNKIYILVKQFVTLICIININTKKWTCKKVNTGCIHAQWLYSFNWGDHSWMHIQTTNF